jgi:Asp-tRNA(Asn)/Glu-tRNA(Gln) amidotransferase A subunit family amidase
VALPSASSTAPPLGASAEEVEKTRAGTLRMTCLAGLGGLPAVSVPAMTVGGHPVGLCLLGPRSSDHALIDVAADIGAALADSSTEPPPT